MSNVHPLIEQIFVDNGLLPRMNKIATDVWVEPHERMEAVEAYRNKLTAAHIDEIEDAPEGAVILLRFTPDFTIVKIIEEG